MRSRVHLDTVEGEHPIPEPPDPTEVAVDYMARKLDTAYKGSREYLRDALRGFLNTQRSSGALVRDAALQSEPKCPECGAGLHGVRYPGGYLNEEQWDSIRAGDFYCNSNAPHQREPNGGITYFWKREVKA